MNALPSPIPLDNEGHSVARSSKRRKTPQNPKQISALPCGSGCTDVCRAENMTADTHRGAGSPHTGVLMDRQGHHAELAAEGTAGAAAPH